MLNYIYTFSKWQNYKSESSLMENIQAAKSFIEKKEAAKLEKKPSELTPEEKEKAINNRHFQEILDLVKDSTGYALPMVKFHFDQGVKIGRKEDMENFDVGLYYGEDLENPRDISTITQLLGWLKKRSHLISQLPMSVDQFASINPETGQKGFEMLADSIRTLERNLQAKWLVDRLTGKLKREFRELSPEKQQVFYNVARSFQKLDKEAKELNKSKQNYPSNRFLQKIAQMSEWDINKIIEYAENQIKAYDNASYKKLIEKLRVLEPEAGIVYDVSPYFALSIRTEKAQKDLCAIANWCLNRGAWENYAGKTGVQINIFNFDLPTSDPLYLTGTTITYDGKVTHSHDINDTAIMNSGSRKSIYDHFRGIGYPEDVCKSLEETIPLEIITKRTLEKINATATSGGSVQDRARNIAKALWDVAGQRISGKINQEEWSSILRVVSEILNNQNNDLMSAIKRKYLEAGIHSLGSLSIFETFILDMLNPNEKEEILEKTNVIFEKMRNVVEALNIQKEQGGSDKKIGEEQKKIDALMDLLNQEDKVLSELKRLLGR